MKKIFVIFVLIFMIGIQLSLTNVIQADILAIPEEPYTYYENFDFEQVSLGYGNSSAITSNGRVFVWGYNNYGQLGKGTTTIEYIPTEITAQFNLEAEETIKDIFFGFSHSVALTSEGRVFAWGYNAGGQLGDGTKINRSIPTDITSNFGLAAGETIENIYLGDYHSSAMTSNGRIFTWGFNSSGQLGDGTTVDKLTPTDITSRFGLLPGETILKVVLGSRHSEALTSEGRVFTWGRNLYGELGDGTATNVSIPTEITGQFSLADGEIVTSLYSGSSHSLAITSEDRVFGWGMNSSGQVGDGTTTHTLVPKEITAQFGFFPSEKISGVSLRYYHSAVITQAGRVFTWGDNSYGQLGDGSKTRKITPIEITNHFDLSPGETIHKVLLGTDHSSAISSNGRLFVWGNNNYGQLGDGTTIIQIEPTEVISFHLFAVNKTYLPVSEAIEQVVLGKNHSASLTSEGRIFTWGNNDSERLGLSSSTSVLAPTEITSKFGLLPEERINEFSLFSGHSAALTSAGRVFTWGENGVGQLGDGTIVSKSDPTEITPQFILSPGEMITKISVGSSHSVALSSEGKIFTWGSNDYGQLGNGTNTFKSVPTAITAQFGLAPLETIIDVFSGDKNASAITSSGRIFTWGYNGDSQLGDGTSIHRNIPVEITSNFTLLLGETIIEVALGNTHSAVLTSEGRVFSWGDNDYGQVGDGTATHRTFPTEITAQFGLAAGETIIKIALGAMHSSALTSSGRIFTWGSNEFGQLGDNSTLIQTAPMEITSQFDLIFGETITKIALGAYHSSAISSSGRIFTWGLNDYGQLGNLTTTSQLIPSEINRIYSVHNEIQLTYTEEFTNFMMPHIKLSIFPEYDIRDLVASVRVNGIDYTNLEVGNGRIDVYISTSGSIGDEIVYAVESITFVNSTVMALSGYTTAQTTLVEDTIKPTITFDYESELYIELGKPNDLYIQAKAIDDTGEVDVSISGAVDWYTPGDYLLTYTASDAFGNIETRQRLVHVMDDIAISGTSAYDISFFGFEEENYTQTIVYENQEILYKGIIYQSLSDNSQFDYEVGINLIPFAFSIEDKLIVAFKTINYYYDDIPPTFDFIPDQMIEVGLFADIDWTTFIVNADDNYSTDLIMTELIDLVDYHNLGTYQVTVSVADEIGNASTQTFNVTIVDTIAPSLNVTELSFESGGDFSFNYLLYATDYSHLDIYYEELSNNVLMNKPGTYLITYRLWDEELNEAEGMIDVEVIDTTAPTFTISDQTISIGAFTSLEHLLGNVSDNSDHPLLYLELAGYIDYTELGIYDVTIRLADGFGNHADKQVTITVIDDLAPTFAIADPIIEVGLFTEIDWTTYIIDAIDNYSSNLFYTIEEDQVDYDVVGNYLVKVNVLDEAGNKNTQSMTVYVVDTTPPTFDEIEDQIIEAGTTKIDWTTYITNINDNYASEFGFSEVDQVIYHEVGNYSVSVSVSDEFGNKTTFIFIVNVVDTTPPTFIIEDQTIEAGSESMDWTSKIKAALDNATGELVYSVVEDLVDYDTFGTYEVTMRVTDEAGNYSEKTFRVEVIDTTSPTYNITIEAGAYENIDWTELITDIEDNSDGELLAYEVEDYVVYNLPGLYTVTLSVKDEAENQSFTTLNITVRDTISPTVYLNPSLDSIKQGNQYTEYGVMVQDVTHTEVLIEGEVDTFTPGVYELIYRVSDTSGNITIIKRFVTVYPESLQVRFELGEANTTITVGNEYHDGTCTIYINDQPHTCMVKENTVNTEITGLYTITYAYTYQDKEYTYVRYVFVVGDDTPLVLYTPFRKEEGVAA